MMSFVSRNAALHSALWSFDRWYRLWWYIWPASVALLICGWIYVEKPAATPSPSVPWGTAAPSVPAQPAKPAPAGLTWPDALQADATSCFSNAIDLGPLIEACSRLISSGMVEGRQLFMAYAQRGYLQRLKQPDNALADYNAALNIQANGPVVLTNRAWIYMTRTQFDAALQDLNKAIELFAPALAARARHYRGYTYFRMRDYDRAISDLNESLRVEPNNPDPYLARGEVEQAKQLYDAALRDFDEFSKRVPRDPRGLVGRATVLEATGRPGEALQAYNDAATRDPANARVLAARDRLSAAQNTGEPAGKDNKP
jgi:tetratricopeptide (TPR) repeat protein